MKISKFGKKNMRRLGAATLSAALLMGTTFMGVGAEEAEPGAQPTPSDVVNGSTLGNDSKSEVTVTGYQSGFDTSYYIEVSWGDMQFIYDRGTYSPGNGNTTKSITNVYPEAGEGKNDQTTSCWFGFDGENNKVTITNRSNRGVNVTATPSVDNAVGGVTKFQLYSDDADWTDTEQDNKKKVYHGAENANVTALENPMYFGGNNAAISTPMAAGVTIDNNGATKEVATVSSFYLNITGAPGDGFSINSESTDTIGTITLNFSAASE